MTHPLPQSVDAERAVLSCALRDPATMDETRPIVGEDDWTIPAHRTLWARLCAMRAASLPIDPLTVAEALHAAGDLAGAGGVAYVGDLVGYVGTTVTAAHYARTVADYALRRRRVRALADLAQSGCDLTRTSDEYAAEVMAVALRLTEPSARAAGDTSIKAALRSAIAGIDRRRQGQADGVALPWPALQDILLGLQPTDLIVLAARPSMGKTAVAMQVAAHAARRGVPTQVYSLEMCRDALALRMLAAEAGVPHRALQTAALKDTDWTRIHATAEALSGAPLAIDDRAPLTVAEIQAGARREAARGRCGLVVVDYLQLVAPEPTRGREQTTAEEIGAVSRGLKTLAKSLRIPVIAVSQLNRSLESRPKDERRPRLSDLRGSGEIEQDADVVAFVYRDAVYSGNESDDSAEIIIAKHRNGALGTVPLRFRAECVRFEERAREGHGGLYRSREADHDD
jgi:replicative DNA helicase